MTRISLCILCLWMMLGSTSVYANTTMGVYFDPEGTITEINTAEESETVPIYVVLHGLEEQYDLTRWQCQVATAGSGYTHSWEFAGEGLNVFTAPHFLVQLDSPLPPGESIVLATGQLTVSTPDTPIWLYLQASPFSLLPGYPGYPDFQPGIYLTQYVGQWEASDIVSGSNCVPMAVANEFGSPPSAGPLQAPNDVALNAEGVGEFSLVNTGAVVFSGRIYRLSGETWSSYESRPFRPTIPIFLEPGQTKTINVQDTGSIRIHGCGNTVDIDVVNGLETFPGAFDLGELMLFNGPFTHHFSLRNNQASESVFEISSSDALAVELSPSPLAPGESRSGTFTFTPQEEGLFNGQIVFTDTTTGVSSTLLVHASVLGNCLFEPANLDFGPVSIDFPISRQLTLTNRSLDTIVGNFPDATGPNLQPRPMGPFYVANGEGTFSLAPGKSQVVEVWFTPPDAGDYEKALDFGPAVGSILLSGQGVADPPELEFTTTEIIFPPTYIGQRIDSTVLLINQGSVPYAGNLYIEGEAFPSPQQSQFTLEPAGSPHGSDHRFIRVLFEPQNADFAMGRIVLNPDPGVEPVVLVGTSLGELPGFSLNRQHMHFGFIKEGESLTLDLTIENHGPNQLQGQIELESSGSNFEIPDDQLTVDLFPEQEHRVEVKARDTFYTVRTGNLNLPWNDLVIPLTAYHGGPVNTTRMGVFFNPPHYDLNHIQADAGDTVEAYIKFHDTLDIRQWEGCLDISGDNELLSLECLAGDNEMALPCFKVTSDGDPLNPVALAKARILVKCDDCTTEFRLNPLPEPIFPNELAVWTKYYNNPQVPIQCLTWTEQPLVATINSPDQALSPLLALAIDEKSSLPAPIESAFTGNFPNPFNPSTTFSFDVAQPSLVQLDICDLAGRQICSVLKETRPIGSFEQVWHGTDNQGHPVPSGVYFARLQMGQKVMKRKIALLK